MDTSKEITGEFGYAALRKVVAAAIMATVRSDLPRVLKLGPQASMNWFANYISLLADDGIREKGMPETAHAFREAGYPLADFSEHDEAKQGKSSFARFVIGTTLNDLADDRLPDMRQTRMLINEYYHRWGEPRPWCHISTPNSLRFA